MVMNKLNVKFEVMKNKHNQELIDIETSMSIQATEWESKVATAEDLASRAQGMVSEEKRKSRNLIQKQFEKAAIERLRLKQMLKTAEDFNVKLREEKKKAKKAKRAAEQKLLREKATSQSRLKRLRNAGARNKEISDELADLQQVVASLQDKLNGLEKNLCRSKDKEKKLKRVDKSKPWWRGALADFGCATCL